MAQLRTFGRWGDLVLAVVVVIVVPLISGFPIPLLEGLIRRVDPHGYWLSHAIQQVVTLLLVICLMKTLSRAPLSEWGFNLRRWRLALVAFAAFMVVWLIPASLLLTVTPAPSTPISRSEIAAVLVFHFVVGGFTQEVLFRGFVMTYLLQHWARPVGRGVWTITAAGIIATLLFMLAHVRLSPPYGFVWQQLASFGLGIYYAVIFERTRSLLGSSLSHNYSNGAYVVLMLLKYR